MKNLKSIYLCFKYLPVIILFAAGAVYAASRYLVYATPEFESTVKIKLAEVGEVPSNPKLFKGFDVSINNNRIGAEVEMVKSKILVGRALDSLDFRISTYRRGDIRLKELYNESPFKVIEQAKSPNWYDKPFSLIIISTQGFELFPPGATHGVKGTFGELLSFPEGNITILKNVDLLQHRQHLAFIDNYQFVINSREQLINDVTSRMDVMSVGKDVPVLRITFKSEVPAKAADFVNSLAGAYIQDYIDARIKAANSTVDFLEGQLDEITSRLANSETDLESYRNDQNIINIPQETETDLRKVAELKLQLANLQMNLRAVDTLNAYMQRGKKNFLELAPDFEAFSDPLSNEIVKNIKKLQADKRDLLGRYTADNEKVKVVDEKINDLTSYLQESIRNTRNNLQVKYNDIAATIQSAENDFLGLPTKERNMATLERNFVLNEKIYNFLHEKKTEAQIARASNLSFHRVIEKGEIPNKPIMPKPFLVLVVSGLLGASIGAGTMFMITSLRRKVNDIGTIQRNSGIPLAAEIPRIRRKEEVLSFFNKLSVQLELRKIVSFPSTIAVSSFSRNEGKAFIAANLGKGFATSGKKVLVVDASCTLPYDGDWQLQLGGNNIYNSELPGLDYYPLNEFTEQTVVPSAFGDLLRQWRVQYDIIIVCNEGVGRSSNALVSMSLADVNLFIMDSRRTPVRRIAEAELLKEDYHFTNLYFILNRSAYNPGVLTQLYDFGKSIFPESKKKNQIISDYSPDNIVAG